MTKFNTIFLIFIFFSSQILAKDKQNVISLNYQDSPVSAILQNFSIQMETDLVFSSEIDKNISVNLQNISPDFALKSILETAELESEWKDNILYVFSRQKNSQNQIENNQKEISKSSLKPLNIELKFYPVKKLVEILKEQNWLTQNGKIFFDELHHSVLIYDDPENFPVIKNWVEKIDVPTKQVEISAFIVTMNKENLNELGVHWNYSNSSSQTVKNVDFDLSIPDATSTIGFRFAKIAANFLDLELFALESENQVQIMANPRLLTLNEHPASIQQGTELPYEVSSGANGATSIEFKQAVLGLEVTPRILSEKKIELDLIISQNSPGKSIKKSDGGETLAINTQEIKTKVIVNEGETLVLGGIYQQTHQNYNQAVPGLSKIPVFGELFKSKSIKSDRQELIIFITPYIFL